MLIRGAELTLIRAVIVGIDHWEDLTLPFSIQMSEQNTFLGDMFIVDNASNTSYPKAEYILRLETRAGYGSALNHGAAWGKRIWDWLLCCNNDCLCNGNVTDIIATLRDDTIYGNKWKFDYDGFTDGLPAVVDSAYFLIPRRVWEKIGGFDPKMEAAFEEIDYCIRALEAGFRLDVAPLPIVHLNMHTRTETPDYWKRWEETRQYFHSKHPARKDHGHPAESDR